VSILGHSWSFGEFYWTCPGWNFVEIGRKTKKMGNIYQIKSKHLFIIPTNAHNYKITGMLKTIKIPTIATTCFGSRRNHHQGPISCLAKHEIGPR